MSGGRAPDQVRLIDFVLFEPFWHSPSSYQPAPPPRPQPIKPRLPEGNQISIAPDTSWERRAARRLEQLAGRWANNAVGVDRQAHKLERNPDRVSKQLGLDTEHRRADRSYADAGVRLIELASGAYAAFMIQGSDERRLLLLQVVSNSSWKDGRLAADLHEAFDLILKGSATARAADADDAER